MRLRAALGVLLLGFGAGCPQQPTASAPKTGEADAEIRRVFADFQSAVKDRDGVRLWDVLADESREDAERKAKAIREDFNKNNDGQRREEMAKNLDLPLGELKDLDGKGYLKTKQFYGKWHEAPGSKVDTVTVTGDRAELVYVEDDEDHDRVKMKLERQHGKWKLIVEMPR